MTDASTRLIVVSNRLPLVLVRQDGEWVAKSGAGGLVSAMAPVLRDRGGTWVGWTGGAGDEEAREVIRSFSERAGYRLHPVPLTEEDISGYYYGFSNEIIWPLFHEFQSRCNFRPEYWRVYLEANRKFAREVAEVSTEQDFIWVHDYHLMCVPGMLAEMGVRRRTGFFLHIPFPPPDIFVKLPWREEVVRALLEYDLVGFHTMQDRRNFMQCVKLFVPDVKFRGRGPVVSIVLADRTLQVGSFPIGIDAATFASVSSSSAVKSAAREFKSTLRAKKIILGVDRLDYTKGIPQRLEAFAYALDKYPELQTNVSLLQVVVPSRTEVPEYQALKTEIEQLVGEINGRFTVPGYVPVHYLYRSFGREELISYYRAAAMALITPLRDGMNLVAKEYCMCSRGTDAVLFLSEFAGAAAQLQNGAVLVNPYDVEGVAEAIRNAYDMESSEQRLRMRKMRETVRKYDIFWWVNSFLTAAFGKQLVDFPPTSMQGVAYAVQDEPPASV